jgi:hypothetical protein
MLCDSMGLCNTDVYVYMYVVRNRVLPPTDQNLRSLLVLKRPRRKSRQCPSESSQSKCMFNLPDAKKTGLVCVFREQSLARPLHAGAVPATNLV